MLFFWNRFLSARTEGKANRNTAGDTCSFSLPLCDIFQDEEFTKGLSLGLEIPLLGTSPEQVIAAGRVAEMAPIT